MMALKMCLRRARRKLKDSSISKNQLFLIQTFRKAAAQKVVVPRARLAGGTIRNYKMFRALFVGKVLSKNIHYRHGLKDNPVKENLCY